MTPQEDGGELELRDYIDVLRRRKWVVVSSVALVTAAAIVISLLQTSIYQATAEVLLQPRASEEIFNPTDPQSSSNRDTVAVAVETEIQIMKSRSVQSAVERALDRKPSVSIAAKGDTRVIAISAENAEPAQAREEANTFARVYITARRQQQIDDLLAAGEQVQAKIAEIDVQLADLDGPIDALDKDIAKAETQTQREDLQAEQQRLREDAVAQRSALQSQRAGYSSQLSQLQLAGNLTRTGGVQLVSEAELPESPIRPTPLRNAVLALLVGLLLGVGLAFLRDYLDESIKTKDDLEGASGGLTVLGLIPAVAAWKDGDRPYVVSSEDPGSPAAEAYRTLRTSVQFMGIERPIGLLQVTSASSAEGKTTTLVNLAIAISRAGSNVILVCSDLRRPRLHEFFGLDNKVGFTSVFLGAAQLWDAVQRVPGESRLAMLSAGPLPPNPSELLSSPKTADIFRELKEHADLVLIDSPPVLPVTDSLVLSGLVDATVFVAAAGRTTRKDAHRAIELLHQVQAPVIGSVLNGVGLGSTYGYGDDSYGYGYVRPSAKPATPSRLYVAPSRRRRVRAAK